jgi:RNA-directed DNA polymerase
MGQIRVDPIFPEGNITRPEKEQTSIRCFVAREFVEFLLKSGKQMNVAFQRAYAPESAELEWRYIDWEKVERQVKKLQMRIAKAIREGKYRKAQSLSWLLTHSYAAKLLAVKQVTTNKGKKTAGVDGVVWKTSQQKIKAVGTLNRSGYKPMPLRRIYIPKKNGKKRPLSIPTMRDRAMQALYAMALQPIAETTGDPNSYAFREGRCCQDAIGQCFCALAKSYSPEWIYEADINACFDEISHEWLLENIPMDKKMLRAWLKAGYAENGKLYATPQGVPQGGIISPIIANMTLDGLESAIRKAVPSRSKVNIIRYADDFIVTSGSKQLLIDLIIPLIRKFLSQRGLRISEAKTRITHIAEGFDFLSQNIRKYNGKLLIKPSKEAVKSLLSKVRQMICSMRGMKPKQLIGKLNQVIRGWVNYHKHVVAKEIFSYIDLRIHRMLRQWAKRRHSKKTQSWIHRKYFAHGYNNSNFSVKVKGSKGLYCIYRLFSAQLTPIKRHIKIRQAANPYDPKFREYFQKREKYKSALAKEYREVYDYDRFHAAA